jgi:hypothetical protein
MMCLLIWHLHGGAYVALMWCWCGADMTWHDMTWHLSMYVVLAWYLGDAFGTHVFPPPKNYNVLKIFLFKFFFQSMCYFKINPIVFIKWSTIWPKKKKKKKLLFFLFNFFFQNLHHYKENLDFGGGKNLCWCKFFLKSKTKFFFFFGFLFQNLCYFKKKPMSI